MRTRRAAMPALLAAVLAVAGCNHAVEGVYQGWGEADLVFVGPDETGRVETLSVREGDSVTAGAPLFTVDADLQQADVQQNQATLANARQAFERAQQLLKSGSGTQKAFDDAHSALREIEGVLSGVSDWTTHALESAVQVYCDQKQLALGKVAQPIRVAITGITISPPIFPSLEMLGRERTLARIERCLGSQTLTS